MKPTEPDLEQILRRAPQPRPPTGLEEKLLRQVELPTCAQRAAETVPLLPPWRAWLNSWWPVVATACLAAACLVLVAVQQTELRELRAAVSAARARQAAGTAPRAAEVQAPAGASTARDPREDLERLRTVAKRAAADVRDLEALESENAKLRERVSAGPGLTAAEVQTMTDARDRARAIACINNLKQLGLAARIWAVDHGDVLPPNLISMSNEISSTKVLICPGDQGRQAATDWAAFSPANCSYEYLAASGSDTEAARVAFRCPIHGHVGLCDGSVQGYVGQRHPEYLVSRGGALLFEPPPNPSQAPPPGAAAPVAPTPTMSAEIMRRYGLQPPASAPAQAPANPQP